MRIIRDIGEASGDCAATIGFFDGVHRGHAFLIEQVRQAARERGLSSLLITFAEHPRRTLFPETPVKLLTTPHEKLERLALTGADLCAVLPFTAAMTALPAYDFMQTYLRDRFGVRTLVIGYDHRFGHNRSEGFEDYVRFGQTLGMEVIQALPFAPDGLHISSSAIRRALEAGDVETASLALGRPYELTGTIVGGRRVGRNIGFPTANLLPDSPDKIVPRNGVYAVQAVTDDNTYAAMLNIGRRPTLNNGNDCTIEAHLLGFDGSLYGKSLTLRFCHRLRDERTFDSLESLTAQLRRDAAQTAKLLLP